MYKASDFPKGTRIATKNSVGTVISTRGTGVDLTVTYQSDKTKRFTGTVKPNRVGSLFMHILTEEPKAVAPKTGQRIKGTLSLPGTDQSSTFEGVVLAVNPSKLDYKIKVDGSESGVWIPAHLLTITTEEVEPSTWEARLAALPERTIIEYKRKPSIWAVKIETGWFSFRGKVIEPSDGFWVLPDEQEPTNAQVRGKVQPKAEIAPKPPVPGTALGAAIGTPQPVTAHTPYTKWDVGTRRDSILFAVGNGPLSTLALRKALRVTKGSEYKKFSRDVLGLVRAGKLSIDTAGVLHLTAKVSA